MKKVLSVALAAIMLVAIAVPAFATAEPVYGAAAHFLTAPEGKIDVLDGVDMKFTSPNATGDVKGNGGSVTEDANANVLTNGVACYDFGAGLASYFNKGWTSNSVIHTEGETQYKIRDNYFKYANEYSDEKKYTFNGISTKYLYFFEASGLNCNADSFAIVDGTDKDRSESATLDNLSNNSRLDSEFDILVSTDGGNTYTVAYSSIPYTTDEAGNITSLCANEKTAECNGSVVLVSEKSGDDSKYAGYKYIYRLLKGDFNKEYTGVTNIVYACKSPRISTSDYAARF